MTLRNHAALLPGSVELCSLLQTSSRVAFLTSVSLSSAEVFLPLPSSASSSSSSSSESWRAFVDASLVWMDPVGSSWGERGSALLKDGCRLDRQAFLLGLVSLVHVLPIPIPLHKGTVGPRYFQRVLRSHNLLDGIFQLMREKETELVVDNVLFGHPRAESFKF